MLPGNDSDDKRRKEAKSKAKEPKRFTVEWRGELVGWMVEPNFDFPHMYGRWEGNGCSGEAFIAALRKDQELQEGLNVLLEGMAYHTGEMLDENGVIDFRMD